MNVRSGTTAWATESTEANSCQEGTPGLKSPTLGPDLTGSRCPPRASAVFAKSKRPRKEAARRRRQHKVADHSEYHGHPCRSDFPLLSALKRAIQADASTQLAELARLRALLFRKWSTRARELEGQPSKEPLKLMPAYSQLSSRG